VPHVTLASSRFYYRTSKVRTAAADKNLLILLHGSGGDSSVWEEQLGENIPVIAPDLPGHGRSDGPLRTSAQEYAAWLDTFTRALEIKNFFLAGHSLGGAIAQEFGRAFPRSAAGLILAGTGTHAVIASEYLNRLRQNFLAAVKASCLTAYASGAADAVYAQGCEMLTRNGPDALYSDLQAYKAFDSRPWAATLSLPALVLCGSDDRITPPTDSEELSGLMPQALLKIIPGAGHMAMMEAPREFNEAVKAFLSKTTENAENKSVIFKG
jgi:pimeloyl-ACP methyl ester carboxylesterase